MIPEQLSFLQENIFIHNKVLTWDELPAPDEAFIKDWEEYIQDATLNSTDKSLSRRLVQLRFPIQKGMSTNPNYKLATLRGVSTSTMKEAVGTVFEDPLAFSVYLYQTYAGNIPVIETNNRNNFETLVQAFSYRNEPAIIPPSMGACMIKGYNNWDRVAKYKQKNLKNFDFQVMKANKELYQDKFLIITDKEYSGVSAEMLGVSSENWKRLSMIIRKEHEATHYFTLRFLGSARNHLFDELIADYMGIVAALGKYRADWFLCFLGLENYPDYRPTGRLTYYLKNIDFTDESFNYLKNVIKKAADNLEQISNSNSKYVYSEKGRYEILIKLTKSNLIELASDNAERLLGY